jgi:hypothetical protein
MSVTSCALFSVFKFKFLFPTGGREELSKKKNQLWQVYESIHAFFGHYIDLASAAGALSVKVRCLFYGFYCKKGSLCLCLLRRYVAQERPLFLRFFFSQELFILLGKPEALPL